MKCDGLIKGSYTFSKDQIQLCAEFDLLPAAVKGVLK